MIHYFRKRRRVEIDRYRESVLRKFSLEILKITFEAHTYLFECVLVFQEFRIFEREREREIVPYSFFFNCGQFLKRHATK